MRESPKKWREGRPAEHPPPGAAAPFPIAIHHRRRQRHAWRPDASPATAGGNARRLCVREKFRLPAHFGIAKPKGSGIITTCAIRRNRIFLGSSTAEHPAVNRRVVGSNPTRGAIGNHFSPFSQGLNFFHSPFLSVAHAQPDAPPVARARPDALAPGSTARGSNPARSRSRIPGRHGCAAWRAARMAASRAGTSSAAKR